MTRCAAEGAHLAFQEHQTGAFVIAEDRKDAVRIIKKFWILEDKTDKDKDMVIVEGQPTEENLKESAVCTALSVLGGHKFFGLVMIIEDRGLYLYRHDKSDLVEIDREQYESTLSVDSAFFCTARQHEIHIRLCLDPHKDPLVLPIHHLKGKITEDNKIWQVSMKGGTVCAISTNEIHICFANGDPGKRNWATLPMSSIVSSTVFASQLSGDENASAHDICKAALLTSLGDVIVVSAKRGTQITVSRIKQNSSIEPFVSSHTRDRLFAWESTGQRLFLCKSGGGLHAVEPVVYTAAVTIQGAWRTHNKRKKDDSKPEIK